jgi:glutamate carboxypeptidase
MDPLRTAVTDYLRKREGEMGEQLKRLVLIPSGSRDKGGVDRLCRALAELLDSLPLQRRIIPQALHGDLLMASVPAPARIPRILLVGHMDTVFPEASPFRGWREDERHFYGPGVVDMKGGLIVGIYALKALAAAGLLPGLPVTLLFNSEEEIGSPVSQPLIVAEAKRSAMAFVLEAGGPQGEIATGRKGRLGLTLTIRGVAGHAATAAAGKKSAILDLARLIVALEGLNGQFPNLSVNVGQVGGGMVPNSVPEAAWAALDVRFASAGGLAFFESRWEDLLARRRAEGMEIGVETTDRTPVMEATDDNRALFAVIAGEARGLGFPVGEDFRAGASDANAIAAAGTPVVDGLGPIGGGEHSDREYLLRESLGRRSALLALSLAAAWRRWQTAALFGGQRAGEGGFLAAD